MKIAAMDLGTNTFLLLLAEGSPKGISRVHKDLVEVVRLGQGVDRYKLFHPYAISRATTCLTDFKKHIDEFKPDRILAVATSAARDVTNPDDLFNIGKKLGIPIEVIEGEREAKISFQGALVGFDVTDTPVGVIDIGGGSTEIITGMNGVISQAQSLNVGGVRLTEKFLTRQPVIAEEAEALKKFLAEQLLSLAGGAELKKAKRLFAVAGTPTALAALEIGQFVLEKVDGFIFKIEQLERWQEIFAKTSVEEKKERYKLGGRADIIFAGTTILIELLKLFGFKEITISTKGVRYGVALQLLQQE